MTFECGIIPNMKGHLFICVALLAFVGKGVTIETEVGELKLSPTGSAKSTTLAANPSAARLSERSARKAKVYSPVKVGDLVGHLVVIEGNTYQRTVVELVNIGEKPVKVKRFVMFKDFTPGGDGERVGMTDGAVAVFPACHQYVGVENPLTTLTVEGGKVTATLERNFDIQPKEKWQVAAVVGSYAEGQLRRDFHSYLNRERAHPYRVLPHYNSWYDINIGRNETPEWEKRMDEKESLGVMIAFREELSKRGVFINSYLWDDGWDDWNSFWDFHPGFPNGFKKHAEEAHKNKGASIGVWMSPCGGYGRAHAGRVKYAKEKGYIKPTDNLLRLSIPTCYAAFRDQVIKMIKDYDMNLFKFDRMGCGHDCEGAGVEYAPDIDGVVRLIGEMRAAKQDVFVNATVGTWASPFWVMYADSIWRGGNDFETRGVGTKRQQWLTYRDDIIHDRFVVRSPLFPLNSMMMHGIIVNRGGPPTVMDISDTPISTRDFEDEVWMGVACGTGLQEYYITPKLMHQHWWDVLANGVKWLKANEKVLKDTHWVGGDPWVNGTGEVYGYASYAAGKKRAKGIVILRNPSDKPATFKATFAKLFELDGLAGAKKTVKQVKSVHSHDAKFTSPAKISDEFTVEFGPFGIELVEVIME